MTIDAYLAELEGLLPRTARLRVLSEVREHLRDSAATHHDSGASRGEAEVLATAEFGEVHEVARRLSRELETRETRLATLLALGAVAAFVFPFYVIPENTLGPAPWLEKPDDIAALQRVALALWLAAGALALGSVTLAWTRWQRRALVPLICSGVALTGSIAVSLALFARWREHMLTTPSWAVPPALLCLATVVFAVAWTVSLRRRLAGG